ncbi:hypothetical protein [Candidatus Sodalis sp. SoCistrobi]|uniref:hypothetical protein n=1 Tax=Candidatus Sodalis sp. SoCistrobi TaxID=1922216 RepID=UPI001575A2B7|nr:hypothetical protein [Candidatus Sodalis sp. SoCistrobi]
MRLTLQSRANAAELDLIREGGGRLEWKSAARKGEPQENDEVPVRRFLRSRKLWGLVIAHMGIGIYTSGRRLKSNSR